MGSSDFEPLLAALCEARAEIQVSLSGFPGRMRVREGWRVDGERAPYHLLYFALEGAFDAQWEGETRRIGAGDLLWAAPGAVFSYRLRAGETLVVLRFRLEARDSNGEIVGLPVPFLHLSPARSCQSWTERIVEEVSYPLAHSQAKIRGLLICLVTEICRLGTSENLVGQLSRAQREIVARYALENAAQWPVPADLARALELSPDYFARCFGKTYGLSPRRFLLEQRIRLGALRLLESSLNVSQIALELGYRDVFLFSRQFKAVMGENPTVYRQNHGALSLFPAG